MIEKFFESARAAAADIPHGATLMVGGWGISGVPLALLDAVAEQGARDLTIIANNTGYRETGISRLILLGRVRKLIAAFPRGKDAMVFDEAYAAGRIEYECVPMGTLAERIRAAGAGLGGFFTPTGYGTALAEGKETRIIDGRGHVFETPLHADYALVKAEHADRWGNLTYHKTARSFGPAMCMAATTTIVQASRAVPSGAIDPEHIVTPGIFVHRVVEVSGPDGQGVAQ